MDDLSPQERRLRSLFAELVAPATARRWEDAVSRSVRLDRRLRALQRRASGRRLAPIGVAGIVAVLAAAAGLAFGLRAHEPRQSGVVGPGPTGPPTQQVAPSGTATLRPQPTTGTTPAGTASPTPMGTQQPDGFTCVPHSGGTAGVPAQLTAIRVASQSGFDRITFEFAPPVAGTPLGGPVGIPEYQVTPQASNAFTKDASGLHVTLEGGAGLRVVFRDASGVDVNGTATYNGGSDLKPGLVTVREVAELGDFERVLTWGVGLSSRQCLRVTELASPRRVVIDVAHALPSGVEQPSPPAPA